MARANVVQTIPLELGQVRENITVVDAGAAEPTISTAGATPPEASCSPQPSSSSGRVGGNIRAPIKIKDVSPLYPASLRGTGASGEVVLDGVIGVDGFVHDLRPREASQPAFVDAMATAVGQWQFRTTLLNCIPVEVPITISGRFRPQAP
jgi:outer membrane biosynthesis protein TonB